MIAGFWWKNLKEIDKTANLHTDSSRSTFKMSRILKLSRLVNIY